MLALSLLQVATFYAAAKLHNGFGPNHSGQDIGGHRAGTLIPSFVRGTVAGFGLHKDYGYWVSVKISSTRYVTFSHMLRATTLARGAAVSIGTVIGLVGATGAFASGVHVHVGYGSKSQPYGRPTYDPLYLIRRGIQPAAVITRPLTKEPNMDMIYWSPTPGTRVWALWTPGYWRQINRQDTATNAHGAFCSSPAREVTAAQAAEVKAFTEAFNPGAPSVDIENLATAIAAKLKLPTKGTITLTP